jgi:hypothetical protein
MRWVRLFLLGLASIYPLYWTSQFALFFLPASLRAIFFHQSLTFVDISFLQATALAGKSKTLPAGVESLLLALLFSFVIWYLRGAKFLTGGLAIAILGQSALLPFLNHLLWLRQFSLTSIFGVLLSMGMICFGLHRVLARTGGADFVDRLALLSLFAVLPEAALWLALRMHYAFFGTGFLQLMLVSLYLSALIASALPLGPPRHSAKTVPSPAPIGEILASFAIASLLFAAIGLSSRAGSQKPTADRADPQIHPS